MDRAAMRRPRKVREDLSWFVLLIEGGRERERRGENGGREVSERKKTRL